MTFRFRFDIKTLDPASHEKMSELLDELRERFDVNEGCRFNYAIRGYECDKKFDFPLDENEDAD